MVTYKSRIRAGAGAFVEDRVEIDRVRLMLDQWLREAKTGRRVVTKVVIDFADGPAAEFTLNEPEAPFNGS